MSESEIILNAVCHVTGISKSAMVGSSRTWPVVEARLLLILFYSHCGWNDFQTACELKRDRTTILKARHTAEGYISNSKSFQDKFNRIKEIYETAKSV